MQLEASIENRMQTDDEETEDLLEISNHRADTVSTAIVNTNIATSIHKVSGSLLCQTCCQRSSFRYAQPLSNSEFSFVVTDDDEEGREGPVKRNARHAGPALHVRPG